MLAAGLLASSASQALAQAPDQHDRSEAVEHASEAVERASTQSQPASEPAFPEAPAARLERAEKAFQDADYQLLRPLLEPTLVPESKFVDPARELDARTLLAVGLYFEAQQVTDSATRKQLLGEAENQFYKLLKQEPDHSLNPLIYPASIVELFEAVKAEHAAELDQIRAERGDAKDGAAQQGLDTVYIEREVGLHNYALNYFPFGFGQYQNNEPIQGTLFATSQALALGLNMTSYWMIESLRGPDGYYNPGPGESAEQARNWRVVQFASLGVFAAVYVWSVLDALSDYQPTTVRIRSLDQPPPELNGGEADDKGPSLQIGLGGIGMAW